MENGYSIEQVTVLLGLVIKKLMDKKVIHPQYDLDDLSSTFTEVLKEHGDPEILQEIWDTDAKSMGQ